MIRFSFRFVGLLLLAGAFSLVVYDGTKSIAGSALYLTNVRGLWELISPASLTKLQPLLVRYLDGALWDPVALTILQAPAFALFGVFGIVFLLLGRRRKPLIGYERD